MRKSIIDNFVRYGLGGVPQFPRRMSIAKYERFKKIPGDKYRAVQKIGAMSSALGSIRNRFFPLRFRRCDNIVTTGKRLLLYILQCPFFLLCIVSLATRDRSKRDNYGKGEGSQESRF